MSSFRACCPSLCEPCFASECDSGRRIIGASEKTAPRPATARQGDSSQPLPESRSGRSASMDPEFRRRSLRGVSRGANGSSVTPARRRSGSGSTARSDGPQSQAPRYLETVPPSNRPPHQRGRFLYEGAGVEVRDGAVAGSADVGVTRSESDALGRLRAWSQARRSRLGSACKGGVRRRRP
jgi:hypothetical protein